MSVFQNLDGGIEAILLLFLLLGAAGLGQFIRPVLPERHRSTETLDTVRLVSSFAVTFSALVLGLLTASVNTAFNTSSNDMNALAGSLRQTANCLADYGPEAQPISDLLRQYTAGAIFSTWPELPPPPGNYPRQVTTGQKFEDLELGRLLQMVRIKLLDLAGADPARANIARLCSEDFAKVGEDRWRLIAEAHDAISAPFYRLLILMLTVVFAGFGLCVPRNLLAWLSVTAAAVTIAAAMFVVLELDGPLDGLIKVSSAAMQETLRQFGPEP